MGLMEGKIRKDKMEFLSSGNAYKWFDAMDRHFIINELDEVVSHIINDREENKIPESGGQPLVKELSSSASQTMGNNLTWKKKDVIASTVIWKGVCSADRALISQKARVGDIIIWLKKKYLVSNRFL